MTKKKETTPEDIQTDPVDEEELAEVFEQPSGPDPVLMMTNEPVIDRNRLAIRAICRDFELICAEPEGRDPAELPAVLYNRHYKVFGEVKPAIYYLRHMDFREPGDLEMVIDIEIPKEIKAKLLA